MLTGAEVLAASLLSLLASPILAAYLLDRLGLAFNPWRLVPMALLCSASVFLWLRRRTAVTDRADIGWFAAVVAGIFGWLIWLARPAFLPLGSGPDLTHHLLLIEFIERHWTLVHQADVESFLGEMVHYTPGSHILAALTGALFHTDGVHAVHPFVAATVALKAGFIFLIALRVLPSNQSKRPLALAAVVLMFAPRAYVLGSFTHESFFAQVVAEYFVVSLWWMLTVWDDSPDANFLLLFFSIVSAAAFLTWPVFVGAPVVAAALLIASRGHSSLANRFRQFALAIGVTTAIGGLYIFGRVGWMQIVRTGGAVLTPTVAAYGAWFLTLSAIGAVLAVFERRTRATVLFVGAIGVEMLGLFAAARTRGNDTPYMALKMFYLLVYPQAITAAFAVACALRAIAQLFAGSFRLPSVRLAAVAAALLLSIFAARPFAAVFSQPAVSESLIEAGEWAKAHVPASCVDYLVADRDTGYWLHLAVLGNPRMSTRTGDPATFDRTAAIVRWLTPGGYPYAVADLRTLPSDVRSDLDIVAAFGTAAVVRRRGPSSCP